MATILAHPTLASRPGLIGAFEERTGLRLFPTANGQHCQALPAIGSQPYSAHLRHSSTHAIHRRLPLFQQPANEWPTGPEAA